MRTKPFNLEEAKAGVKVVTGTGFPVRIICYDMKGDLPIVGLVTIPTDEGGEEEMCVGFDIKGNNQFGEPMYDKLYILDEDKSELTEFEKELCDLMRNPSLSEIPETAEKVAKAIAPKFLAIAKKQLRPEFEAEYWGTQKAYFKGKEDGKAELLKELPKWRKRKDSIPGYAVMEGENGWDYLVNRNYEIQICKLNCLPKENEEEDWLNALNENEKD